MPVGDCQAAFGAAAIRDGHPLVTGTVPGLTDAGHLGLQASSPSRVLLERIFELLAGDAADLQNGQHRLLPLDWLLPEAHLIIEVDESQHFTSDRLGTLRAYPADAKVAFSISEYKALCEVLASGSDRYRLEKEARGFRRPGGRRAQRAYFDAVKDLAAPDFGWRVLRVPAGHSDGARAFREVRRALIGLMSSAPRRP